MSPSPINVIMLAAGIGKRLGGGKPDFPPKCLLEFAGRSLLERHLDILQSLDAVSSMTMVVGYESDKIKAAVATYQLTIQPEFILNDRFDRGSNLSLWHAFKALTQGLPVLFMDADVLYAPSILEKLVSDTGKSVVPFDSGFEPGDEPVKVCFENDRVVEFGKCVGVSFDQAGEWPGFMRLSPAVAASIADILDRQVEDGNIDAPYEDAFREVILSAPEDSFEFFDVKGIPWIEIDFPEDLERADSIIAPQLENLRET